MQLETLLRAMVEARASDLFLKVGTSPCLRLDGRLVALGNDPVTEAQLHALTDGLLTPPRRETFHTTRELNVAFACQGLGRFRANLLWQQGTMALVIRRIQQAIPTFAELGLPVEVLSRLITEQHGLVLVTGPTGSGKSTTIAAMLEAINHTSARHIMTLEDPIEFQFEERQAVVNQREVGVDTHSFREGLRQALRQSPDVLFISDIRDLETVEAALSAAEAGQLVLSCVHTLNAVTTVERLIAFFPPHQHRLIRLRLSLVLRGCISLRLLPRLGGEGRVPACEILVATPRIRELIREGHTDRVPAAVHDGATYGMQTLTHALYERCRRGEVDPEDALRCASSPEELQLALREIRATKDILS